MLRQSNFPQLINSHDPMDKNVGAKNRIEEDGSRLAHEFCANLPLLCTILGSISTHALFLYSPDPSRLAAGRENSLLPSKIYTLFSKLFILCIDRVNDIVDYFQ